MEVAARLNPLPCTIHRPCLRPHRDRKMAEEEQKLALGVGLIDARNHCLIYQRREASTIST